MHAAQLYTILAMGSWMQITQGGVGMIDWVSIQPLTQSIHCSHVDDIAFMSLVVFRACDLDIFFLHDRSWHGICRCHLRDG